MNSILNLIIPTYFTIFFYSIFYTSSKYFEYIRIEDILSFFSILIIFIYWNKISQKLKKIIYLIFIVILFYVVLTFIYHFLIFSEIFFDFENYKKTYRDRQLFDKYIFLNYNLSSLKDLNLNYLFIKFYPLMRFIMSSIFALSLYIYLSNKKIDNLILFFKLIFFIIILGNYSYVSYQFFTGNFYGYHGGVEIIGENSPFIASYIMAFIILLSHILYLVEKNFFYKFIFIISIIFGYICLFSIDSRTTIISISLYFMIFFSISGDIFRKQFFYLILLLLFLLLIFFSLDFDIKNSTYDSRLLILKIFEFKHYDADARYGNWLQHLNDFFLYISIFPFFAFTGLGFGGNYILYNMISTASDNTYLSIFYQLGLSGIFMFCFGLIYLLINLIKEVDFKNYKLFCIFISFLFSTLLINFNTHEILFVGKANFLCLILLSIYITFFFRLRVYDK